jgi:Tfp pilus assembly protein PilF
MAIYLPQSDALILLVPKTGSRWVTAAIEAAGIQHEHVGPSELRGHANLHVHGRHYRFIACFVRNPIAWYRSYWSYRMERGWRPKYLLDRQCQSDDFRTFVRRAVRYLPGALSEIFNSYTGYPAAPIDFIGRQEHLAEDLIIALRRAGERFEGAAIRACPVLNATQPRPDYPEELKELITLSEFETMVRFGYAAERPDPIRLRELCQAFPDHATHWRRLALWTEVIHWQADDAKTAVGKASLPTTRHARTLGNFALYLQTVIGDYALAQSFFEAALEADPQHPRTLCNYALFLHQAWHQPDTAETLFQRALTARPDHAFTLGHFAAFLERERQDYEAAERYYRQALALDGREVATLLNFARFQDKVRANIRAAQTLYEHALRIAPEQVEIVWQYGQFLENHRPGSAKAKTLYAQALLQARANRAVPP